MSEAAPSNPRVGEIQAKLGGLFEIIACPETPEERDAAESQIAADVAYLLAELRGRSEKLSFFVPKADEWVNSNQRLHRMVKANRVKAWRESAAESVPPNWPPFDHPVRIVAEVWKNRRGRYDPNNLNTTTKACVDGFVDAGLLVDDDWEHVLGPDHRHGGIGEPGIIFHFLRI